MIYFSRSPAARQHPLYTGARRPLKPTTGTRRWTSLRGRTPSRSPSAGSLEQTPLYLIARFVTARSGHDRQLPSGARRHPTAAISRGDPSAGAYPSASSSRSSGAAGRGSRRWLIVPPGGRRPLRKCPDTAAAAPPGAAPPGAAAVRSASPSPAPGPFGALSPGLGPSAGPAGAPWVAGGGRLAPRLSHAGNTLFPGYFLFPVPLICASQELIF